MNNQQLSELIGLIYDVADDVTIWPRVFDLLSDEMESILTRDTEERFVRRAALDIDFNEESSTIVPRSSQGDANQLKTIPVEAPLDLENTLIDLLLSHFTRALKINRHIHEVLEERNAMAELLDRLPLGMMIVDSMGRVVAYNRKLDQIALAGKGILIQNGELTTRLSTETAKLKKLIRSIANGKEQRKRAIHLSDPDHVTPVSVLVIPFKATTYTRAFGDNKVVVLVATPGLHLEIPEEFLISTYKLTAAEARLVSSLVKDLSLNSIAQEFGVSKHTIRTQLKSVYEKTGTHRQAELVRQVITGPAMLAAISGQNKSAVEVRTTSLMVSKTTRSAPMRNLVLRLPDNRMLGYAQYGVLDGLPVIHMHAMGGSRLQRHPDETIIERIGVRLIIPDRPGGGLSDSRERMTLLDWARDVEHLADHLRLERFAVLGWSIGCPFALACAYQLQKRISRLVLVSSTPPIDSISDLDGSAASFRLLLALGRYTPSLLGPLLGLTQFKSKVELLLNRFQQMLPHIDPILGNNAAIQERFIEDSREGLRQGDRHIQQELQLISGDWGFELNEIKIPVELWYGERDPILPAHFVKRLIEALPNRRTNWVPYAGHLLLYGNWEKILRSTIQH